MQTFLELLQKEDLDGIKEFFKTHDLNLADRNTPLHYAAMGSNENNNKHRIFELLVSLGADVNYQNNYTPLIYLCGSHLSKQAISFLLEYGTYINLQNGNTALHYACFKKLPLEVIQMLLDFGADPTIQNNRLPQELTTNKEVKSFLECYTTLNQDLKALFERQEFCDLDIKAKNGECKAHSLIMKLRLGDLLEKALKIFQKEPLEHVKIYINFLYSGIISPDGYVAVDQISTEIGIPKFHTFCGRNGILKDLEKLFLDQESKDFEIIFNQESIKVHKLILISRSDLFRGMFLSVKDDSNKVQDYSRKSISTIRHLIRFFYLDDFDSNLPVQVIKEMEDVVDYYQLNKNTSLKYQIELQQNRSKKDKCFIF
ncbi:cyclin-dependent kinase inhibitor 2c [Anaeramoeba ignava]|uniref:Cyclin-dependent kinase inhibitor 2c n=1 Tax=Anaeramoeba ignava TaxID=1746090 RepID=A0A9Q0LEF6_ANAIG|nr:cyclin-dependent kinase inhibitor 2c [Anaeramoeba ignava]